MSANPVLNDQHAELASASLPADEKKPRIIVHRGSRAIIQFETGSKLKYVIGKTAFVPPLRGVSELDCNRLFVSRMNCAAALRDTSFHVEPEQLRARELRRIYAFCIDEIARNAEEALFAFRVGWAAVELNISRASNPIFYETTSVQVPQEWSGTALPAKNMVDVLCKGYDRVAMRYSKGAQRPTDARSAFLAALAS